MKSIKSVAISQGKIENKTRCVKVQYDTSHKIDAPLHVRKMLTFGSSAGAIIFAHGVQSDYLSLESHHRIC